MVQLFQQWNKFHLGICEMTIYETVIGIKKKDSVFFVLKLLLWCMIPKEKGEGKTHVPECPLLFPKT